ncbi:DNA-binding transcriptional regulator, MerR family [Arthrobacter alpinus]|uniref:DNA-binding transcriptional regulator, MerR family n=1 Tax=Arthrobacter alpinus TaxID=656366 RepID=A0A1H5PET2_9MICC|nr:MerR family transcriptional regulator [Arthrobacter alpinus]SEF12399.1 DNA-binding transcriptional regulator, MerR family [Arthrobacter alpinus]
MFTIGEFAQLTNITVKALHHYDEVGLLRPAEIDPSSRYRSYAAAQLRPALLIRALRDVDVPLKELADVVDEETATVALERHHANQQAVREAQDRAHERASAVIRTLGAKAQVQVREARAQPFIGAVIRIDDSDENGDSEMNDEFGALYAAANELGVQPTGELWTTLRSGERESIDMVLCLAVGGPLGKDSVDSIYELGELPHRREIVTAWLGDQSELVEGVLHPAVMKIFEELERSGLSTKLDNVRQVNKPDGGVEVATTLKALSSP